MEGKENRDNTLNQRKQTNISDNIKNNIKYKQLSASLIKGKIRLLAAVGGPGQSSIALSGVSMSKQSGSFVSDHLRMVFVLLAVTSASLFFPSDKFHEPAMALQSVEPATTAIVNGPAGSNGWYTGDVVVELTAEDRSGAGIWRTLYRIDDDSWRIYHPRDEQRVLLVLGDSISMGNLGAQQGKVDEAQRWPNLLRDHLSAGYGGQWAVEVVSASGGTSTSVLITNRDEWDDYDPDAVVIELGINNTSWRYGSNAAGMAAWESDVRSAVPQLLEGGKLEASDIMIMGLPPHGRNGKHTEGAAEQVWNQWNGLMASTAADLGCTFLPMQDVYDPGFGKYHSYQAEVKPGIPPPPYDPDDYIWDGDVTDTHPNAAGHRMWFEQCLRHMAELSVPPMGGAPVVINAEGVCSFRYRSIDNNGNMEPVQEIDIKVDKTAPAPIDVTATSACDGIRISWRTAEPAESWVEYGKVAGGGKQVTGDNALVTEHEVTLPDLAMGEPYEFHASSVDQAGLTATAEPSFFTFAAAAVPSLTLSVGKSYWNTLADYYDRILSVDYEMANRETLLDYGIGFLGTSNTGGVFHLTAYPGSGVLKAGGRYAFTVKYLVPHGIISFRSTLFVVAADDCLNTFTFPGPYPGI